MAKLDLRKHSRQKMAGPVRLSWTDASSRLLFARGQCMDASEDGMQLLVTDPLPKMCTVAVAIARLGFSGSATVRHIVRAGRGYLVGLHLSQPIPGRLLVKDRSVIV